MRVLVLGHNGMLGHMVYKYFIKKIIQSPFTIEYRYPSENFFNAVSEWDGDYIINCIGHIPQKTDNFTINYLLPTWLDLNCKCKIIHPGTDCEMDTDQYGVSKRKASYWIKSHGTKTKIIKTSIIGPELDSNYSLMEWFLSQEKEVSGYSEFYWNGNTTLTWCDYCLDLMFNWDKYEVQTVLQSPCISKYELLNAIKDVYNKDIEINKVSTFKKNKCLLNGIKTPLIKEQLKVMKEF